MMPGRAQHPQDVRGDFELWEYEVEQNEAAAWKAEAQPSYPGLRELQRGMAMAQGLDTTHWDDYEDDEEMWPHG